MKDCNVVEVGAEGDPVDFRRRDAVLDLHRPLVQDQHGAGGDHEEDGHELRVQEEHERECFVLVLVS